MVARAVVGAAALAVLLAGCGSGAAPSHAAVKTNPPIATSTSAANSIPTVAVTAAPAPVSMLPAGAQASSSDVPWSLVGPGWILATWSANAPAGGSVPTQSVYLIDPEGGRYLLGPAPTGTSLEDWSGDGQRALFVTSPSATAGSAAVDVMDLRTGSTSSFALPGEYPVQVSFTRPDGTALLVPGLALESAPVPTRRYTFSGTVQQTYPIAYGLGAAESPDGTLLATGEQGTANGTWIVSNSGQPVRFLSYPPGGAGCATEEWWNASDLLVGCQNGFWLQPAAGGAPTLLAPLKTNEEVVGGVLWQLPSGKYSQGAACGTLWLVKLNPDGTTTRLQPPRISESSSTIGLGTYGDQLAIEATPSCDNSPSSTPTEEVAWYNPATGTVTPLLGGTLGGDVYRAVLFDGSCTVCGR